MLSAIAFIRHKALINPPLKFLAMAITIRVLRSKTWKFSHYLPLLYFVVESSRSEGPFDLVLGSADGKDDIPA
jgi:hypothetical protein